MSGPEIRVTYFRYSGSLSADLEYHWGEAYNIVHLGPETWVAQRRDSHSTVGAKTPDGLLERIRQDYLGRPVPRQPAEADA